MPTSKQLLSKVGQPQLDDKIINKNELNVIWDLFAFVNSDEVMLTEDQSDRFNGTYDSSTGDTIFSPLTPSGQRFYQRLLNVENEKFVQIAQGKDLIDVFADNNQLTSVEEAKVREIVKDATDALKTNNSGYTIKW